MHFSRKSPQSKDNEQQNITYDLPENQEIKEEEEEEEE